MTPADLTLPRFLRRSGPRGAAEHRVPTRAGAARRDDRLPSARPVWVLLGRRTGDNKQLLAAADALGLPYQTIPLQFRLLTMPNILLGCSLSGLRNPQVLPAGSPKLVLSIGRRSPPVARWIRQRSGGSTRLVHFGRPWGSAAWFDLVVTTPQYGLTPLPNVICNSLPFLASTGDAPLPASLRERFAQLPRPWTVILAGGDSRPYVFDSAAATQLAAYGRQRQRERGGSLFFVPSPRTGEACVNAVEPLLEGAPSFLYRRERHDNPYTSLLQTGDHFVVTCDSVLMTAEALAASRSVEIFELPRRPDWRYRLVAAWQHMARRSQIVRRVFELLRDIGVLTSTRDIREFHARIRAQGMLGSGGAAAAIRDRERAQTLARIHDLIAA